MQRQNHNMVCSVLQSGCAAVHVHAGKNAAVCSVSAAVPMLPCFSLLLSHCLMSVFCSEAFLFTHVYVCFQESPKNEGKSMEGRYQVGVYARNHVCGMEGVWEKNCLLLFSSSSFFSSSCLSVMPPCLKEGTEHAGSQSAHVKRKGSCAKCGKTHVCMWCGVYVCRCAEGCSVKGSPVAFW